jgi:glycosyltransferase involved in cell wall biosynthesis
LRPDISIAIPTHNEGERLIATIRSLSRARTTHARLEFLIVDDASSDGTLERLRDAAPRLLSEPNIDIKVARQDQRAGVPRTRNHAAALATAEVLFITDSHVRICRGWDARIAENLRPNRIVAGGVTEENTPFVGYGCRLVVPFMGTYWNKERINRVMPVQIAACPATALHTSLFRELGGYDPGMRMYGAAEPEFSVRAWLHGAEIAIVPRLQVQHRFKPQGERERFIAEMRPYMVHNSIRFGLLYLSELGTLQLLRYYSRKFPGVFSAAMRMVDESDVFARRAELEQKRKHPFSWFVQRFNLKNQIGGEIL